MTTESSTTDIPDIAVNYTPDGIATLTFSSGDLNLYSLRLHEAFDEALNQLELQPPRVLVIRSASRLVSGGVDVNEFYARKTQTDTKQLYDRMLELPQRVAALKFPTIFAANGLTLTWAFEVALACDLLIATPRSKFGLVERVVGLIPFMGGVQRIIARAGSARAKQIVLSGRTFEARTLDRWDIVNEVVDEDQFDEAVLEIARDLANGPTRAFSALKDLIFVYEEASVGRANAEVTSIAADLFSTADVQEGVRSFLADGPGRAHFVGH